MSKPEFKGLSTQLLTPETSLVLLVDYQKHVMDGVGSTDHELIELNARALARVATAFDVPVILSTIGVQMRGDAPTLPSIRAEVAGQAELDRTTMNAWEDRGFIDAVKQSGRRRLIFAGLWTEVCLQMPVLHAQREGWETYFVVDAVGGASTTAHKAATRRMVMAGSQPLTISALVTEWIRDWASSPHVQSAVPFFNWYGPEIAKVRERLRDAPYHLL